MGIRDGTGFGKRVRQHPIYFAEESTGARARHRVEGTHFGDGQTQGQDASATRRQAARPTPFRMTLSKSPRLLRAVQIQISDIINKVTGTILNISLTSRERVAKQEA